MILVLEKTVTQEEKNRILSTLREDGCMVREMSEAGQSIMGVTGKAGHDANFFQQLPGVAKVVPISTSFRCIMKTPPFMSGTS